jgi:aryl-alcohol dehydrogenase-like predicted oxidoreductase
LKDADRLAIGTAQFGSSYGIANTKGQVSESEASAILRIARQAGSDTVDTAMGYGTSEEVLGRIGVVDFRVVTKLPEVPEGGEKIPGWIDEQTGESLHRLGVGRLAGLLLHRPLQLLGAAGPEIYDGLLRLKRMELVEKIGFSIYSPEELDQLWDRYKPDVVQVPFNILDRRIQTTGWLKRMTEEGVEVHVRSIFLQGLLLMNSKTRPTMFNRWRDLWDSWDGWLEEQDSNPVRVCLKHALSQPEISRVVIGVDSSAQLGEILESLSVPAAQVPSELISNDAELLNPSLWPQLKG